MKGKILCGWIFVVCVLSAIDLCASELPTDAPPRMVNGVVIEGTVVEAVPDGLTMQTPKGTITYPWKYLSASTRHRYERPMLEEMRAKAEAEALAAARQAARDAARAKRAAEQKAAAEAKKAEAAAAAGDDAAADSADAAKTKKVPAGEGK